MTFENLGLSTKVLQSVATAGFVDPTPIQAQAIPAIMGGRDVVGIAQTGTGKTGGFVLPLLTRLETGRARARMPRSLILEPTRELAAQVAQAFEQLGGNHKLTMALLIGGVSFEEQFRKLDRGADVLIATPGRLLDHFGRGKLLLSAVEIVVIDEGDRMLDMGFIPDIERICKLLPTTRQTLFFSATMPKEVQKLADKFLSNPERIEVAPQSSAAQTIVQRLKYTPAEPKQKRETLRELIRENAEDVRNAIIFCNRKRDVGILLKSLQKHGFNAGALHGDMEQRDRTTTLEAFRNGEIAFLAASDVAARGLDIPEVSHVYNFDVPVSPEDYVHRIGRTGRAGREGFAATLVTADDIDAVRAIEKLCRQKIDWIDGEPSAEELEESRKAEGGRRRGRGRRGSARSDQAEQPRAQSSSGERRTTRTRAKTAKSDVVEGQSERDSKPQSKPAPRKRTAKSADEQAANAKTAPSRKRDNASSRQKTETPNNQAQDGQQTQPQQNNRRKSRKSQQEEPVVIGMGEHVPAFLMTPIRRSK
ncbi:MAG: DEAD/DEAH box helicase [Alphaproteobacteria bacterium]